MKNIKRNILITGFILLLIVMPAAGALAAVFGSAISGKATENEENRSLAAFPEMKNAADLISFPDKFTDWFSDHLPWKAKLVSLKNEAELLAFGELNSDRVIVGTDRKWLFNRSNDGEPLETYKRTNLYTDEELEAVVENLSYLQADLEDAGIGFVLLIAPDKEQIYGERYMPASIKREDHENRTEQLIDALKEYAPQINVVYPAEKLKNESIDRKVYYETDTHWNLIGASIACGELEDMIEAAYAAGTSPEKFAYEFAESGKKRGDLQKLVQLGSAFDSTEYMSGHPAETVSLENVRDGNDEIIWELGQGDARYALPISVYLSGDSFRWNLTPYVQDAFSDTVIASRYYLDLDDIADVMPDVFVYEIAERYLGELDMIPGYNTAALINR